MTTENPKTDDRVVVNFMSGSVKCIAIVCFGQRSLNMRCCQINLGKSPSVNINYLPDITRVIINDGDVWFDTDSHSATRIKSLFQTGIESKVYDEPKVYNELKQNFVRSKKIRHGIEDPFLECNRCGLIGQQNALKEIVIDNVQTEYCCPKCENPEFYILEPKK